MLSHSTLDEKAEILFDFYDFDKSKYITRDELVILITNTLTSLNSMAKKDPPKIKEIEKETDEFFTAADLNNDNKITLKEFKSYLKKNPTILNILMNFNIAKIEDLGTDFGGGDIPECDSDLENEINPPELHRKDKVTKAKQGVDFGVVEGEGGLFVTDDVGGGDEFMAVKPWKGVIDNSIPSDYKPSKIDGAAPDANLKLEYVYGYRCHDVRNNLRYTPDDQFIYHTAAMGITMNPVKNTQRFHFGHKDDIMSFALHPNGKYAATGEIGPKPLISIWSIETMAMITSFNAPLTKGIAQLAFSPDGKYLAGGAMDDDHCVAIFEWEKNEAALKSKGTKTCLVASGKGSRSPFCSLTFSPDGKELVGACIKEVRFFTYVNGVLKSKTGTGWGKTKQQAVLCATYVGTNLVTGIYSGDLLIWKGLSISKKLEAHKGSCNAIWNRQAEAGFITGGNDGLVIVWSDKFVQLNTLNIKDSSINSYIPKVRSVCENAAGTKILVGTRGGEIIEFTGKKSVMHLKSHCQDELWGLTCHPSEDQFYTVGQDCMLAIWDIKARRQLKFARLDCAANVIEFSPNGSFISIGYTNGQVTVLDSKSFAIKSVRRDRKKEISEIKFDPNTKIMAVGSMDSMIYLYNVEKKFKPLRKLKGHHSRILHIDFSEGGDVLKSVCTSYEILFFDTSTGKQVTSGASAYRDEKWETYTARLGWHVQGIWPAFADGSDINSVDRSPDGLVCATADDFGFVKLFRFPCPVEKAAFHDYIGHSSHVTRVRFHKKISYLISTGGNDKAVFQWKYLLDKEGVEEAEAEAEEEFDESELGDEFKTMKFEGDQEIPPKKDDDEGGLFASEDVGGGDERLAVLPFKGEVDASWPSDFRKPPNGASIPDGNLVMDYVHGYRSFDMRDSVKYADDPNEIIYTTACLGIVLKKKENEQRFFNQHRDDVVSMDIHPLRNIVATGQMAEKGRAKLIDIYVWDSDDCSIIQKLTGFHRRAVNVLRFSPSGQFLLSVGEDDNHSVAIYEWKTGRLVGTSKVSGYKMLSASWKDDKEFVICGVKEVKFFTINGSRMDDKRGLFGKSGAVPICSCVYAFKDQLVTGTTQGKALRWSGRSVSKEIKLSKDSGQIWSMCATSKFLIIGDSAGAVYFLDNTFATKKKVIINSKFNTQIRSIDYLEATDYLLVGTRGAEIYECIGEKQNCLMRGHYDGEVWGAASHPEKDIFVTCGGDKTVRIWDTRKMIKASDPFEADVKSCDWSSSGKFICVGGANGKVYNLDAKTLEVLGEVTSNLANKSNHCWIEDIKFSPDNTKFAFGTHGGLSLIELVNVDANGKISKGKAIDVKMTSALTHLDWSADSSYIVANSQAYEIFWVNAETYQRVTASSAKDIEWYTWTCVLGFPVIGIFPGVDFTDVNTVCRSHNQQILATGEDTQKVKLFRYPCYQEGAKAKEYFGHSSHLTEVKFSPGDDYLVTVGGNDKTVIVWKTDFGKNTAEVSDNEEEDYEDEDLVDGAKDEFEIDVGVVKRKIVEQKKEVASKPKADDGGFGLFEEEDAGAGDEFMAVKPWLGQMREPSNFRKAPKNQETPPSITFELEWVHGYRARDSKNNVAILADGCVVYHAAAVGIVYDPDEHSQRHFNKHIDDITTIAFASDQRTVATGEIGPHPSIYVWDACTMQELVQIKGKLKKGIQALCFSPSGKYLAGCAIDVDHHVAVFDAKSGVCLAMNKGGGNQIVDIAMKNDTEFVTVGVRHFKAWTMNSGTLKGKNGSFQKGKYSNMVVNCTFYKDTCITGTIKGEVLIWSGNSVTKCIAGKHEGPVDAIEVHGDLIFTGGRNGNIAILDSKFSVIQTLDIKNFNSECYGINAFAYDGKRLIIGTRGSEVFEVDFSPRSTDIKVSNVITAGHYSPCRKDNNEVWGLCIIPNTNLYVSVGDDATLRVWNAADKKMERCVKLIYDETGKELPFDPDTKELSNAVKGRSIDVTPNGKMAAVGFRDGSFRIYTTKDWKCIKTIKERKSWVQDLKFSPDGQHLAVSCHERFLDVYIVDKSFKKLCQLKGHTGAITHLDWSESGEAIHSTCNSYELLYWDMGAKKQDPSGASNFRDENWHTWTVILGWPVQGIWEPGMDGSDINAVDRSPIEHNDGYRLLATGDDRGKVKVFRYPSMIENSQAVVGNGHSSHVTMVKFSSDGKHVYSAGGNDTCIFQWRVGM